MKEGSTRRKSLTTSFRKCYILKPENSSPKRDSNPHSSIGGRLGKQTCQPLHHASQKVCTFSYPRFFFFFFFFLYLFFSSPRARPLFLLLLCTPSLLLTRNLPPLLLFLVFSYMLQKLLWPSCLGSNRKRQIDCNECFLEMDDFLPPWVFLPLWGTGIYIHHTRRGAARR